MARQRERLRLRKLGKDRLRDGQGYVGQVGARFDPIQCGVESFLDPVNEMGLSGGLAPPRCHRPAHAITLTYGHP